MDFSFSSFHNCSEYKWDVCKHCRSRHKCNDHIRPVYPSEEGIYYPIERIEISPQHATDLGFYIHEFTETSIIQILRKFRVNWHKDVHFKGYGDTYISHFITPWGTANGRSLFPVTRKNKPTWKNHKT